MTAPTRHEYALSDVYLAVRTGRTLERHFRTRFRDACALMLRADLGLIEPVRVDLPDVELGEHATKAADLFRRLYGAQLAAGFPDPGAMSVRLVAEWCGCSKDAAHEAIRELVDRGVLERAGKVRRSILYRPRLTD